MKRLLKPEEVAQLLSIDVQTVGRLARRGKLPFVLVGRVRRFDEDEILAALPRSKS